MCLAVSMWYYIFQCIWDSLAGLDAPLQSTNPVFGIFLLTDKHNKLTRSCQELPSPLPLIIKQQNGCLSSLSGGWRFQTAIPTLSFIPTWAWSFPQKCGCECFEC